MTAAVIVLSAVLYLAAGTGFIRLGRDRMELDDDDEVLAGVFVLVWPVAFLALILFTLGTVALHRQRTDTSIAAREQVLARMMDDVGLSLTKIAYTFDVSQNPQVLKAAAKRYDDARTTLIKYRAEHPKGGKR